MMMPVHSPNHTPLFKGGEGVVNAQFIFLHFCVGHSILSIHHYPHVNEGAKRLRPGESTKARGAPVENNNTPVKLKLNGQGPEDFTTFSNGHLAV